MTDDAKQKVYEFWNAASCGEVYAKGDDPKSVYEQHSRTRYALEPYIHNFAKFNEAKNKKVLEIGVGMGADHLELAKANPSELYGIDLTERAIEHTNNRLNAYGLKSKLSTSDAEKLDFPSNFFDFVYSWGVLHHSPNTDKAFNEVHRVLKPGGVFRGMIYNKHSITGLMLWLRYGLMKGKPFTSLDTIYSRFLESPGTKAYTLKETKNLLCGQFDKINLSIQLSFGDLLEGEVGQRHKGVLLSTAKIIWPRFLIKRYLKNSGLYILCELQKKP
jgi:ubiquinone/menaquinone biosynthesis C-methylase UbiE